MSFGVKAAAAAAFASLLTCCGSPSPFYYGYKPSVSPTVAMSDLEACHLDTGLSPVLGIKAAQILTRAATKQTGAQTVQNKCLQRKGYQIRQMSPEDKKRFMALDIPNRKVAAGRLMTTGKL